jgi:trehalose-6-phosphatase
VMGRRVVEVKDAGTDKGLVVADLVAANPEARLLVVGDDATDEDMFRAAPAHAVTIHVGSGATIAKMRLIGPDQVRKLLVELLERLDVRSQPDQTVGAARQSGTESTDASGEAAGELAVFSGNRPSEV